MVLAAARRGRRPRATGHLRVGAGVARQRAAAQLPCAARKKKAPCRQRGNGGRGVERAWRESAGARCAREEKRTRRRSAIILSGNPQHLGTGAGAALLAGTATPTASEERGFMAPLLGVSCGACGGDLETIRRVVRECTVRASIEPG